MRISAALGTMRTEPAACLWGGWAAGGTEPGVAARAGMLHGRWLHVNISASSNFLSAVKISGSWNFDLLKTAAGLT